MYRIDFDDETMAANYLMLEEDTYTRETCPVTTHADEYDGYGGIRCPCCGGWTKKWSLIAKYYRGMFLIDKKKRKEQLSWNIPKTPPESTTYWHAMPKMVGEMISSVI